MTKISQRRLSRLARKEYRQEYMREIVRGWVSHQIKALREQRDWSQDKLGELCNKPQATIGRLESPSYGRWNITSLFELAEAFDVALEVKFVSWPTFLRTSEDVGEEAMRVGSWSSEDFVAQGSQATSYTARELLQQEDQEQVSRLYRKNQEQSVHTASELVLSGRDWLGRKPKQEEWTHGTSRNRRVALVANLTVQISN